MEFDSWKMFQFTLQPTLSIAISLQRLYNVNEFNLPSKPSSLSVDPVEVDSLSMISNLDNSTILQTFFFSHFLLRRELQNFAEEKK